MSSTSYLELHQQVSPSIEAEIESALERLGPSSTAVKSAITKLLQHQKLKHPLSVLPLLVHAIETGTPRPAIPLSAIHVLWWTSACYLDDLADGQGGTKVAELSENEALLASLITGHMLPIQVVQSQQAPEPIRSALTAEITNGWIAAVEGQLDDMRGDVDRAARASVITAYRGKSGAPFGMITAMAAILSGARPEKIEQWREFGNIFGILWQIFNDQDDILSGRNEDLQNGTVTYLLACSIEDASPRGRETILDLYESSRSSEQSRSELTRLLLRPSVLSQYHKDIKRFRNEAIQTLTDIGGDESYRPVLRELVDLSAQMLLKPLAE
ncbi:polyprenyl synthetase family protein [Streptomyces albipurpureus]|uniref:Polyprenyl synthetase family protein n=1 Tax=Streptomyces albipurpureus TaxID=2897419 RepID=A0ABT0UH54_9ACTN|nr:polyprenyl synthetase family protein [Streptomyces sp. CWNU-1]MCM2387964.1 polyprenyl synthetase family protein [Streptomyces sp. CWNU-1]